jgi:hypothetical protein
MSGLLLGIILAVIAVFTVMWAVGKVLWWLRVTIPPRRKR